MTVQPEPEAQQGHASIVISWLCLFAAAALLAILHLSPKLLAWADLEQQREWNLLQLIELEQQVEGLSREAEAFLRDPHFAAEVARADFQRERPGEQRIPVEPHLVQPRRTTGPQLTVPAPPLPWWYASVRSIEQQPTVRQLLLGLGICLVFGAFVPLRGSILIRTPQGMIRRTAGLLGFLRERYRPSR